MSNKPDRDDRVLHEVASWYARLSGEDATEEDRAAFKAWLAADPDHGQAFRELQRFFGIYDALWLDENAPALMFDVGPGKQPEVEQPAKAGKVQVFWRKKISPLTAPLQHKAWVGLAACLLLCVCLTSLWVWPPAAPNFQTASTRVGEQRTLELADGSTIYLNTGTTLDYALTDRVRRVRVKQGEAYFEVAGNKDVPFIVSVGGREIRVVGTAFNIRYIAGKTAVTVTEGNVDISAPTQTKPRYDDAARLTVGMAATYSHASKIETRRDVPLTGVDAWRRKKLFYQNQPLSEVVADLDRYFEEQLIAVGPDADKLNVTAIVNLSDRDKVLNTLSQQLPIRVVRQSDKILISVDRNSDWLRESGNK